MIVLDCGVCGYASVILWIITIIVVYDRWFDIHIPIVDAIDALNCANTIFSIRTIINFTISHEFITQIILI